MTRFVVAAVLLPAAGFLAAADPAGYPPPKTLGPVASYGANVQRAMTLLATSTPEKRNTVRVLFYGQSITAQPWTAAVARDLRARFPFADLQIENRAIGGYGSNVLVRTAEADLYPAYPDLLIFHVYGPVAEYEAIVRRVRERTTADVLHATDHIAPLLGEKLDEPTDPARLTPADGHLWKNHVFLPGVSARYGTELADVRGLWRQYIRDHRLSPSDLLADELHPNDHGGYVMAEVVKARLRHRPELPAAGWRDRVTTHAVGAGAKWENGTLTLPFDGNRVDLLFRPGAAGSPVGVRIDGKRPSQYPELFLATRAYNVEPPEPKPILMRVGATAPPVVEEWTLTATDFTDEGRRFKYTVSGSVTGADGAGDSAVPFVSKSGRVAIEPPDFHPVTLARAAQQYKQSRLVVRWNVLPLFADTATPPPARGPGLEAAVTVAQGLRPGRHVLELTGGPDSQLEAVRVFRPPLRAAE
ncbi:MAG TPA: SGNH/GDSL hydrolase family protein [Urbifossiella sp.]|nr:SGNH/GDSL hydrolase family protein [Urbifossiella sp.]